MTCLTCTHSYDDHEKDVNPGPGRCMVGGCTCVGFVADPGEGDS
jgi:hypothetical protein